MFFHLNSAHWMLMAVKPHQNIIYWFDSLNHPPRQNAVQMMEAAFTSYNANAGRKDAHPTWINVKVYIVFIRIHFLDLLLIKS